MYIVVQASHIYAKWYAKWYDHTWHDRVVYNDIIMIYVYIYFTVLSVSMVD